MFAVGMAAGPLLGGALLEKFWWGSAFLVALPIAGILLIAGPLLLHRRARDRHGGRDRAPGKAGSASAMSEMVQELGIALGVAVLGSFATVIYRSEILGALPPKLDASQLASLTDGLATVSAIQDCLPQSVIEQAQTAFVSGLNAAAMLAALIALALAMLAIIGLRHVRSSKAPE